MEKESTKLWGGRFSRNTDAAMDDFHSSIHFDQRLYKQDILGSIAHAGMLGKTGIIDNADAILIQTTLQAILVDIENGIVSFSVAAEDIHMNVETILIERIGDVGKCLHTGRSRNDQVALDLRMYLKAEINKVEKQLQECAQVFITMAEDNLDTVMPGYTHLQRAQPITFAHHLMAYVQMFLRDIDRLQDCYKRTNVMPLGSGALAGTTYPLNREMVCVELGFANITNNSLDGVSDRDFVLELASDMSIIMVHLSRFCEEIILWCSTEFAFIELDDAYSTGSSIMPQKKNPDAAELIRGKSGRVFGSLSGLLAMMKGLPLAYNKDMQEDKEAIFNAVDTVSACLNIFTRMVNTMKVKPHNMRKAAAGGFTNATDVADYLVKKGLPFRDSHEVIGKMVAYCLGKSCSIEDLSLEQFKSFSNLIEDDVYNAISLERCVADRNLVGGPAKEAVLVAIKKAKEFL